MTTSHIHLPEFAAFGLVESTSGQSVLKDYYADYLSIARDAGCGFILESPTWRANPDWGRKLGYDQDALRTANREAIALMQSIRRTGASPAA
jgi:homocysteine S-methyltransferase